MRTTFGHLLCSIDMSNTGFYRDLFLFFGWNIVYDGPEMLGLIDSNGIEVWFGGARKQVANDYDGPGLNHLGIHTSTQAEVDRALAFLAERNIVPLFGTPRHRPEFAASEENTYYQIMFETPDRLLFEVVYIGPKA